MDMKLTRYAKNPIIKPLLEHEWESLTVFNAGVVYYNQLFHMLYRAQGQARISRIGYAVSDDGFNWIRLNQPVFEPGNEFETWGVEDPRITRIDDTFYMLYTAYSEFGIRLSMARSSNLITWERMGIVLPDEDNKDGALFPEKIGGRYCLLHRRPGDIWLAYSDDLLHWTDHQILLKPRSGTWENEKIGAAGPPLKTERGWLLIYHGVDNDNVYRLGVAMLDLNDPAMVLAQQAAPILKPEAPWELMGDVPNVVFSCGAVGVDDMYYIYYGGADKVMAVATIDKKEILSWQW
jgi:predicted GH43/DUF377 family glycosyl hydrolase